MTGSWSLLAAQGVQSQPGLYETLSLQNQKEDEKEQSGSWILLVSDFML